MKPRNKYAYAKQFGYGRHNDKRQRAEKLWHNYMETVHLAGLHHSAKQRRKTWES